MSSLEEVLQPALDWREESANGRIGRATSANTLLCGVEREAHGHRVPGRLDTVDEATDVGPGDRSANRHCEHFATELDDPRRIGSTARENDASGKPSAEPSVLDLFQHEPEHFIEPLVNDMGQQLAFGLSLALSGRAGQLDDIVRVDQGRERDSPPLFQALLPAPPRRIPVLSLHR